MNGLEASITDALATTTTCSTVATDEIPPMDQCTAHFTECLLTPLGNRNSDGLQGHSICRDCLYLCEGQEDILAKARHGQSAR